MGINSNVRDDIPEDNSRGSGWHPAPAEGSDSTTSTKLLPHQNPPAPLSKGGFVEISLTSDNKPNDQAAQKETVVNLLRSALTSAATFMFGARVVNLILARAELTDPDNSKNKSTTGTEAATETKAVETKSDKKKADTLSNSFFTLFQKAKETFALPTISTISTISKRLGGMVRKG